MRSLLLLAVLAVGAFWLAPSALAAGWCGSGETPSDLPDIVTGQQIHAIVAVPSDAPDTFAVDAGKVADDVASISSWWIGQDPTRVPRFDEADFGGTDCLDISFVRLPGPGEVPGDPGATFNLLSSEIEMNGLASPFKKYLVYFDGPTPNPQVCGVGGGDFSTGPSMAIVFLNSCAGVPTDTVAAHELLHALGALPAGAPNACPGDPGHPCDSPTDVLYPVTGGEPLSQKVLDFNHDDYYDHPGSWIDIRNSLWLHHLDTPEEPLAVSLSGSGEVVSNVPGLVCAVACQTQWDQGWQIFLQAFAASGSRFVGWSGACTGALPCPITMSQSAAVTAIFGPLIIPVKVTVAGKGRVTCSPACSPRFVAGQPVKLHAVAEKGWKFTAWSGNCKGTKAICYPLTNFAVAARATFRRS